jgi:hypothetical protein
VELFSSFSPAGKELAPHAHPWEARGKEDIAPVRRTGVLKLHTSCPCHVEHTQEHCEQHWPQISKVGVGVGVVNGLTHSTSNQATNLTMHLHLHLKPPHRPDKTGRPPFPSIPTHSRRPLTLAKPCSTAKHLTTRLAISVPISVGVVAIAKLSTTS